MPAAQFIPQYLHTVSAPTVTRQTEVLAATLASIFPSKQRNGCHGIEPIPLLRGLATRHTAVL